MNDRRPRRPRPTYANVAATLALVAACSGTAVAVAPHLGAGSVGPRQLQSGAVRSQHIADGAVRDRHVLPGALAQSDVRGLVPRVRGPLPAGARVQAQGQAAGGQQGLSVLTVTGPPATPQSYPDVPSFALLLLHGGFARPDVTSTATARSVATCPAGTVALSGAVATSSPQTVGATFVRTTSPGAGTYPGTWTFTPTPGGLSLDQRAGTVSASATFTGVFASPAGSPGGQWVASPAPTYWGPPNDSADDASPALPGVDGPVPGLSVQAVAYCLELTAAG